MRMILAVNKAGWIGKEGKLPWYSSEDLKHFKSLTIGDVCLVGRKTWENMPDLIGRHIIVLTTDTNLALRNAIDNERDITEVHFKSSFDVDKIDWLIGGRQMYEKYMHLCSELYLSIIDDYTEGDEKCPNLENFNGEIKIFNFKTSLKKEKGKKIEKKEKFCAVEEVSYQLEKSLIYKADILKILEKIECGCDKCNVWKNL